MYWQENFKFRCSTTVVFVSLYRRESVIHRVTCATKTGLSTATTHFMYYYPAASFPRCIRNGSFIGCLSGDHPRREDRCYQAASWVVGSTKVYDRTDGKSELSRRESNEQTRQAKQVPLGLILTTNSSFSSTNL